MSLSSDLVEFLKSTPEVRDLVARGVIGSNATSFPEGYIFDSKPYAKIDDLSKSCTVVIYSLNTWDAPLRGSRLTFPLVTIEIWAAPSKDSGGNVAQYDATDVIEEVYDALYPYIHLIDTSPKNGSYYEWGASKIVDSQVLSGPVVRPVLNASGAQLAVIEVGVQK